jgi:hypothetical protein
VSHRRWRNTLLYAVALVFLASALVDFGRWSDHWVFIVVYGVGFLWCLWRMYWLGVLAMGSVIWLRLDLAEHVTGLELRLSSAVFAISLIALCVVGAEQGGGRSLRAWRRSE